jgi:hypothetical protein
MAQSCEMESYEIENAIAAQVPPPEEPDSDSLFSEQDKPTDRIEAPTVSAVLSGILRHPVRALVRRWNWKAALLSSLLRSTIFFFTNLIAGWHAALGAMLAELVFRSITSGFYGAITESFSLARPAWAATATAIVALPLVAHSLEFLVHWLRGTPKLGLSIGTSAAFTGISTAFNLYAMRRGILTTSGSSKSLQHDLSQIPGLLLGFVLAGPREIVRRVHRAAFPE